MFLWVEGIEDQMPFFLITSASERKMLSDLTGVEIRYSETLEEMTGADMMFTPSPLPAAPATLHFHFEAGAFLVQVKRGNDLPSSVGDRLSASIARMMHCGTRASWQRILLYVGTLSAGENGSAIINGQPNTHLGPHTYWAVRGAIAKWQERGGSFDELSNASLFPTWLQMKLNHWLEFFHERSTSVVATPDPMTEIASFTLASGAPMQDVVEIRDWRRTLQTFPGLGPVRISSLYAYMVGANLPLTLLCALTLLADEKEIVKIPGLGKTTCKKVNDWLGISDPQLFELSLVVREDIKEPNGKEQLFS